MKKIVKTKVECFAGVLPPITYTEEQEEFQDCMEHFSDEKDSLGLMTRCYTVLELYDNDTLIKSGYYGNKNSIKK